MHLHALYQLRQVAYPQVALVVCMPLGIQLLWKETVQSSRFFQAKYDKGYPSCSQGKRRTSLRPDELEDEGLGFEELDLNKA